MIDIEIPLGKRTKAYRFFEMLPALLSYGAIILLVVLALVNPLIAAIYLLAVIITTLVKAVGIAYHTTVGRNNLEKAQRVDWHERLMQLEHPEDFANQRRDRSFRHAEHIANLAEVTKHPDSYPKPSSLYNAVIIAAYNESFDVLQPTFESLLASTYDKQRMIVVLAYEERGGRAIEQTAQRLQELYGDKFHSLHLVRHPKNIEGEVVGKGGNITHAGRYLQACIKKQHIPYESVVVTTLDSDNKPHLAYFDYLLYEYIVHPDRKQLSYQPICLFINNIWDVPAPMRVVATGNSFWNIISAMRPHTLRNFASHSQPMDALVEMDFWST